MSNHLINQLGNKYGKLTVISLTKDKNNRAAWLCNCDCGNTKIVRGSDLRKGRITSCGCGKGKHPNNIIDITKQKFNYLTAIKYEYSSNGKQYWSFKCDCGIECIKQKESVMQGQTKSCGCKAELLNRVNNRVTIPIGTTFGLQKVIKIISNEISSGRTKVLCKCIKCGREKEWILSQLKFRPNKSCICCISYPEYQINQFLTKQNINFKSQYIFQDLTGMGKYPLRFDFAILNETLNVLGLIEYNGQQHYKIWDFDNSEADYKKRQIHDNLKKQYCNQHNIPLLILTKDSNKNKELQNFIKLLMTKR